MRFAVVPFCQSGPLFSRMKKNMPGFSLVGLRRIRAGFYFSLAGFRVGVEKVLERVLITGPKKKAATREGQPRFYSSKFLFFVRGMFIAGIFFARPGFLVAWRNVFILILSIGTKLVNLVGNL